MMLFLLGIILTGFLIRSPRFSSASNAVSCLCFGLLLSAPIKSSNSIFENCLDGLILILWGLGFLVFTAAAIKDFRKARREEVPESHLAD
jgi:K+-sensing histidine kinase KdpD